MMIASIKPERLEGLFLMSPAGTEGYDPATYETRSKSFLNLHMGSDDGLIFKKSEILKLLFTVFIQNLVV